MDEVLEVLDWFGQQLLALYKEKMTGSEASGLLVGTADYEVIVDGTKYQVGLNLQDYAKYIESGRQPGTWPNIDAIRNWISIKPIIPQPFQLPNGKISITSNDQLTFLISRAIFEDGIEPKPYIQESINELMPELLKRLTVALGDLARINIINELRLN